MKNDWFPGAALQADWGFHGIFRLGKMVCMVKKSPVTFGSEAKIPIQAKAQRLDSYFSIKYPVKHKFTAES